MASKNILEGIEKGFIAPSILSADFSRLGEEIKDVEAAGAEWIHVDVMDGHFVPNVTIGPLVVKAIRPITKLPLDCHLMVENPEKWIEAFAEAGADVITIHAEATPHLHRVLSRIKEKGCLAGVAINPSTPISAVEEVLDSVDLVLVMSVNPGFGGQKFIEAAVDKIARLSDLRGNRKFVIEVDGGVSAQNFKRLFEAGCNIFVAGSAVFGQNDRKAAMDTIRKGQ